MIVHNPIFVPPSEKESNTHAYAHLWLPNDGNRNQ